MIDKSPNTLNVKGAGQQKPGVSSLCFEVQGMAIDKSPPDYFGRKTRVRGAQAVTWLGKNLRRKI